MLHEVNVQVCSIAVIKADSLEFATSVTCSSLTRVVKSTVFEDNRVVDGHRLAAVSPTASGACSLFAVGQGSFALSSLANVVIE